MAMHFGLITLFPEMLTAISNYGITRHAIAQDIIKLTCWNPRDFTHDTHRTVDDKPYGGGPGMVMCVQPLKEALSAAKTHLGQNTHVINLSPQGRVLTQAGLAELKTHANLILVAGRYEGIDERFIESYVDEQWSIGDYILTGGELGAMVLIDGITRLLPGSLGQPLSLEDETFNHGLLEYPQYTRPQVIDGCAVPEVLLSGHHDNIVAWRKQQSLMRTEKYRPDLLEKKPSEP